MPSGIYPRKGSKKSASVNTSKPAAAPTVAKYSVSVQNMFGTELVEYAPVPATSPEEAISKVKNSLRFEASLY